MFEIEDDEQKPETNKRSERWMVWGFSFLFFGMLLAELLSNYSPERLSALFFIAAWAPLVAIHELGHALAARACGWRVDRFVIGTGKLVTSFEVRGTLVQLRLIPLSGYVLPIPNRRDASRLANAFIYAAGPGIELMLVGLAALVLTPEVLLVPSDHVGVIAIQASCVAALYGAITNLIPFVFPNGQWTDGMGILMSPFMTSEHVENRMAAAEMTRAAELMADQEFGLALALVEDGLDTYPDALSLHLLAAKLLLLLGRREEALLRAQSLVSRTDRSQMWRDQAQTALEALRSADAKVQF